MKESASWSSNLTTIEARSGKEQRLTYEIPRPDTTEHLSTQLLCYQDNEGFKEYFSIALNHPIREVSATWKSGLQWSPACREIQWPAMLTDRYITADADFQLIKETEILMVMRKVWS